MPSWSGSRHALVVRLAALGLSVIVGALVLAGCATPKVPTVDELAARYRENRTQFRRVIETLPPGRSFEVELTDNGVVTHGVSEAQVAGCADALRRIGVARMQSWESEEPLDLILGERGLAVSGVEWGYSYYDTPPEGVVSLEQARSPDAPELWLYPVGDGWYAYVYNF